MARSSNIDERGTAAVNRTDLPMARRRFLLKTLGLGAAGLAAGGTAAWVKGEMDGAAVASATLGDLRAQLEQTTTARAALEMSYGALQAQLGEVQAQLAATASQNQQLSGSLAVAQQEATDLRSALATTTAERDALNTRLARVSELVALYEQLEAAGLDQAVEAGLGVVTGALATIAGPASLLQNGVAAARQLLQNFEAVLPDFKGAMSWLGEQVVKLKVGLWSVEATAKQTVGSAMAGFAAVFGGFVGFVLDHLPFDIGKPVRETLAAVEGVLASTTGLTDNAPGKVLLKISRHVDDGPQDWKTTLVAPLRDGALAAADDVLNAVSAADGTYKANLKAPAESALAQRRAIRETIAAFRAQHGV